VPGQRVGGDTPAVVPVSTLSSEPVVKSTTLMVRPSPSAKPCVPKTLVLRCSSGVNAVIVNDTVAPCANSSITTCWSTTSLSQS
jgi:hypothetical protein